MVPGMPQDLLGDRLNMSSCEPEDHISFREGSGDDHRGAISLFDIERT